jgi:lipoprotein signal peptidase
MHVLHLWFDLRIKKLEPHMHTFEMAQNAGIAFRVGSCIKKLEPHMRTFKMAQNAGIAFRVRFLR